MNQVFLGIISIAFLTAAIGGSMGEVSAAALASSKSAVDLAISLIGYMALFLGVILYYAGHGEAEVAVLGAFVLITSVITSYAKARAETQIKVLEGGLFERGERVGLLAAGAATDLIPWALAVLAVGGAVTVAQRFSAAYRELERLDAARSAPEAVAEDSGAAQ